MDNEKSKYQYEGMKWIMELQLLNQPQAINTLKFNILMVSNRIREVELLIYRENQTMLVFLDLSWIGRTFQKKQIFSDVHEVLQQLLPSFRFRITDDPNIMNLAINRVKKALTGGKDESYNISAASDPRPPDQPTTPSSAEAPPTRGGQSVESSEEESLQTGNDLRGSTGADDSKEE